MDFAVLIRQLQARLAASGISDLRIVRGTVGASGSVDQGDGWTVTKNGTGDYTVTFTTAFSNEPSVALTAYTTATWGGVHASLAHGNPPTTSAFRVRIANGNSGAYIDAPFEFVAVGPQ